MNERLKKLMLLIRLGTTLGATFMEKARLTWFLLAARFASGTGIVKHFRIIVEGKVLDLHLRNRYGDAFVLHEAFISRDYDQGLPTVVPQTIVDIGANLGFVAMYLKVKYPDARIVCVEPDPDNFAQLALNMAQFVGAQCIPAAVGAVQGTATFYRNPVFHMRHSLIAHDGAEQINVPVITLSDVLDEAKIDTADLVKCDVEGGEINVFAPSAPLTRLRYVIGELHPHLLPAEDFNALLERLSSVFDLTTHREGRNLFMYGGRR